jgi:hypothetical protein
MNKNLTRLSAIFCAAFFLSACAGRQANTVAAIQPGDDALTCDQIVATLKLNTITVRDLMGESSATTGRNVAAGVAGAIIFFPALFFMDTKNAAGDEARALVRRNEVLFKRHQLLKCEPKLEDKNTAEVFLYWNQDKPSNTDTK